MAGIRVETQAQFHARNKKNCENLAEIYERRASACPTDKQRERWLSKAGAERRNADLHRRKLDELGTGLIG